MKQATFGSVMLAAVLAAAACAADSAVPSPGPAPGPAAAEATPDKPEAVVPKREVSFSQTDEEYPLPFFLSNPKLAEQRYVATFSLVFEFPRLQASPAAGGLGMPGAYGYALGFMAPGYGGMTGSPGGGSSMMSRGPGGQRSGVSAGSQPMPGGYGMAPGPAMGSGYSSYAPTPVYPSPAFATPFAQTHDWVVEMSARWNRPPDAKTFLQYLAQRVPADRLPAAEIVAVLTQGADLHVRRSEDVTEQAVDQGTIQLYRVHLQILAGTPEEATRLAQGLLTLVDYGFLFPAYRQLCSMQAHSEKQLAELRAALEEHRKRVSDIEKELEKLKEVEDVSRDALMDFRTQQRAIYVDLAGLKARIDACNRILAGSKDLPPARTQQVENIKIGAEIEMIGLAAKRDALEEIIKMARRRISVSAQCTQVRNEADATQQQAAQVEPLVKQLVAGLKPEVFFGKVVFLGPKGDQRPGIAIRRIKWQDPNTAVPGSMTPMYPGAMPGGMVPGGMMSAPPGMAVPGMQPMPGGAAAGTPLGPGTAMPGMSPGAMGMGGAGMGVPGAPAGAGEMMGAPAGISPRSPKPEPSKNPPRKKLP